MPYSGVSTLYKGNFAVVFVRTGLCSGPNVVAGDTDGLSYDCCRIDR